MNKRTKTTGNREVLINPDLIKGGKKLIRQECKCETNNTDLAAIYAIVYSIRYTTRADFNFSLGHQWFTYDGARRSDKAIAIDLGREVTPMHDEVHSTLYFVYGDHGKLVGIGINKDNDPYVGQDLYVEFENLDNEISSTLYGMVEDMYMDARRAISRRAIFGTPLKYIKTCGCDCEDDECNNDDLVDSLEDVSDDAHTASAIVYAYNTVDKVLNALKIGSDYESDCSDRSYRYLSRAEFMGIGLSTLLTPDGEYSRAKMLNNMKYAHTRYYNVVDIFPENNTSKMQEYKREYYDATLRYLFVYIVQTGLDAASDMVAEFNRIRTSA